MIIMTSQVILPREPMDTRLVLHSLVNCIFQRIDESFVQDPHKYTIVHSYVVYTHIYVTDMLLR